MLAFLVLVSASSGPIDCQAFAARSAQPIETKIEKISGTSLDPGARPIKKNKPWDGQVYQIGKLVYQGNGYSFRSSDSRFSQVVDSFVESRGRICHYQILVPDGYDAATGEVRKQGEITFDRVDLPSEALPGSIEADRIGTLPVLDGYVALSSWPIYAADRQMFVALMRPADQKTSQSTAIVVFSSKSGPMPATVIANVQGAYSDLFILPYIHGPGYSISLNGRGSDGSLRRVSLEMDGQTANELASSVTPLQ